MKLSKKEIMDEYNSGTRSQYLCNFFESIQNRDARLKFEQFLIDEKIIDVKRCETLMDLIPDNEFDHTTCFDITYITRIMVLEYYLDNQ